LISFFKPKNSFIANRYFLGLRLDILVRVREVRVVRG